MKKFIYTYFLGVLCFISTSIYAQKTTPKQGYILILSSIEYDHAEYQHITEQILNSFFDEIPIKTLSINPSIDSLSVTHLQSSIINRFKNPRLVIFMGEISWASTSSLFSNEWKNIPNIVIHKSHFSSKYLKDVLCGICPQGRNRVYPQIYKNSYNTVFIQLDNKLYDNISLMRKVIPNMTDIAFISDNQYSCAILRNDIQEIIENNYPELSIRYLTKGNISSSQLIDSINSYDQSTGIIFASWQSSPNDINDESAFITEHIPQLLSRFSKNLTFSLNREDILNGYFTAGCFLSTRYYRNSIVPAVRAILRGQNPNEINVRNSIDDENIVEVNYPQLLYYNVDPLLFSQNTIFHQKPKSFYEKHKPLLITIIVSFFIVILIYLIFKFILQRHKEKIDQSYARNSSLIKDMPIMYICLRPVKSTEFEYPYYIITDMNSALEHTFHVLRKNILNMPVLNTSLKDVIPDEFSSEEEIQSKTINWQNKYFERIIHQYKKNDFINIFFIDRTEKQTTLNKLVESSLFNKQIINSIEDPLFIVTKDGSIQKILNNPTTNLFTIKNFLGKNITEFESDSEQKNLYIEKIANVLKTHVSEKIFINVNGLSINSNVTTTLSMHLSYFNAESVIAFVKNVTNAEQERQEAEKYYFFLQTMVNNLPIHISVKDAETMEYTLFNKLGRNIFDLKSQDINIENKTSEDVFANDEFTQAINKLDQQTLKEGFVENQTIKTTTNEKTSIFLINKLLVNYHNKHKWIITSCFDMTELQLKQSEIEHLNEMYKLILNTTHIISWSWDLPKGIISCETKEGTLELSKEAVLNMIDPEYRENIHNQMDLLIFSKQESLNIEYEFLISAQKKWFATFATISKRDTNGNPIRIVGASQDISHHKTTENELREAKEGAEESNRLKSAFLANMSHEIRTPLNAIVGFSNILAVTSDEKEKKEYTHIIEQNNQLLLQLINDILDLSKIEAGTLEVNYTSTDLNKQLLELEQTLKGRIHNKNLVLSFSKRLPQCTFETDVNRLNQVFINLINNAIKFTTEGRIDFGYEINDSTYIRFFVRDTGQGIKPEHQNLIFNRFIKLNPFAQGSGLGLSICKMIINHLGGEIGVESEYGKGSTFWFTIPYKGNHVSITNIPTSAVKEETTTPVNTNIPKEKNDKPTILVAEDNASNYKLFESILKDYNLYHAWDGLECIKLFSEVQPDIILMDIKMPNMDGYEATLEIRKLSNIVPIIAVTAYAFADDEREIMRRGFNGYAAKPVNAIKLKEKIAEILKTNTINNE